MSGNKISFAGSSLTYEQGFNNKLAPTSSLLRLETGFKLRDWSFKGAPGLTVDNNGNKSPQLRFRALSPNVPLGKANEVSFTANAEYRGTLKFNEEFKRTDFVQELRGNFAAKNEDYQLSITPKALHSEKNPTFKFNGVKLTLQKTFDKWALYFDTNLKPEAFKKGDLSQTSYALGLNRSF